MSRTKGVGVALMVKYHCSHCQYCKGRSGFSNPHSTLFANAFLPGQLKMSTL